MTKKIKNKIVIVNDKMQKGYKYELVEPVGKNFHKDFKPDLTPKQMLKLGVFGGKYMNDCISEFPKDYFVGVKLSPEFHNPEFNYFKVNASQSLSIWQKKGWINKKHDPRGWFQWYMRYYMGRRIKKEDEKQIKRWKMMTRHIAQITKNCRPKDLLCRRVQRQALLHWAYDSRKI
jgi:hypothetical protein